MKKTLIVVGALGLLAAGLASAHEGHKHGQTKAAPAGTAKASANVAPPPMKMQGVELVGELVDPQCWFTHDGRGAKHRDCAVRCAEGGQDLSLYETKTGRIYPIIAVSHGKNPNEGLVEHVAVPVRISGTLFSRGANHALLVKNIQRVK